MKKSRVLNLIFALIMIPLLSVFLLTFSVNVKAADINSNTIPYNLYGHDSLNTLLSEDQFNALMNFVNVNNVLPSTFNQENMLMWIGDYNQERNWYYVYCASDVYCQTPVSDSTNFTSSTIRFKSSFTNGTVYRFQFTFNAQGNFSWLGRNDFNNANIDLLGSPGTVTTSNGTYTPSYPFFYNGDGILYNDSIEVIVNREPIIINTGHATAPNPFDDIDPGSHTLPHQVPSLTFNYYSWTTAPTPDLSTLENATNSIFNLLSWLGPNLIGQFSNLIDNIESLGDYIGATIQYYCGLIFNAIKNGIETFYNNMVSLFEPMLDQLANVGLVFASIIVLGTDPETGVFSIPYLTNVLFVPSTSNVIDLMIAHDEFSVIPCVQAIAIKGQYIINQLVSVTPSHTFHVPSCYYHGVQIGDFDIDFGWYANYKIYVDAILNGFLILGYILWLFVTFKDHLRGTFITGNDDPHVIGSNNHIKGD